MPRAPPARPPPVSSMLLHPVHLKQKSLSAGRGWALLGATERRSWTGARCGSLRGASGRRGLETPGCEAGGVGAEIPQPPAPRHPGRGEERRSAFLVLLLFPPTPTPGAGARGVGLQGVWGGGLRRRVYLSISLSSPLPSSLFPLPTHPPPLPSPPLLSPLFPSTTSLSLPLSLSPSFCFAMPSLVVSGIMERNGGFGELGCFGGSAKDRGLLEDERALQLALDQLCLLGLGEPPAPTAGEDGGGGGGGAPAQPAAPPQPAPPPPPAAPPAAPTAAPAAQTPQPPTAPKGASDAKLCALYKEAELRLKGSSNTTECVPVPTSEHVAEIVGRQGCKIKALRAKTNTYIKTPVRGEEPVFMVTGRREDVATARREIISAAEHFSMIRASRNKSGAAFGVAPALPGQVTIRVRVPYRVVGLVVGPKGATIKRIQQQTNTYIITPSRDRDPVFEITGAPGNVERAREEIETHIAVRTGKILEYNNENDFLAGSPDAALDSRYSEAWRVHPPGCKPLSTFRQNSLGCIGECGVDSGFEAPRLGEQGGDFGYGGYLFPGYGVGKQDVYYGVAETSPPLWAGQENATPTSVLFSSASSSSSSAKARAGPPGAHRSPATSAGPELAGLPRRPPGEPLQGFSKLGGGGLRSPGGGRDCMVCFESEVTAALVPCGHNLFCMECAVRICERTDPECPVCHITATQAIRIFS
ncbi:RNA-binding protein MEX3A [Equus przewalskii]